MCVLSLLQGISGENKTQQGFKLRADTLNGLPTRAFNKHWIAAEALYDKTPLQKSILNTFALLKQSCV